MQSLRRHRENSAFTSRMVYIPTQIFRSVVDIESLRVDGLRLQHTMEEMAKIGAISGNGVQRLSLSNEGKETRDLFI